MNIHIPNEFVLSAAYYKSEKHGEYYHHFGIHSSLLSLYGVEESDLRKIKLRIIPEVNLENRKESNEPDYWGLYDFNDKKLKHVYPSFIQFEVCFPYGPKVEEDIGRAKCLNLKVVEVLPYE